MRCAGDNELTSGLRGSRLLSDKVIIEVCPNEGAFREGNPRMSNPHVPYSPEEIAADSYDCYNEGASAVHFHAREPETGAFRFHDPDLCLATMQLIHERCPLIAYPTAASGPGCYDHYEQGVKQAGVRWETGQADLAENQNDWLLHKVRFLNEHGLRPSFSLFNAGDVRALRNLIADGLLTGADPIKLMLAFGTAEPGAGYLTNGTGPGELFPLPPTMRTLNYLLEEVRDLPVVWMPFVFGDNSPPLMAHAIAAGGHVRLGLGNYAYPEFGFPTNAELVRRVVSIARAVGREPATPDEARALLGIPVSGTAAAPVSR